MKPSLVKITLFVLVAFLSSCGSSRLNKESLQRKEPTSKAYYIESSGLTMDDAVVIFASGSMEGIPLEYEFVAKKEGRRGVDWNLMQQSLIHEGKKSYDVLRIKLVNSDQEKTYYFDITDFFGKF